MILRVYLIKHNLADQKLSYNMCSENQLYTNLKQYILLIYYYLRYLFSRIEILKVLFGKLLFIQVIRFDWAHIEEHIFLRHNIELWTFIWMQFGVQKNEFFDFLLGNGDIKILKHTKSMRCSYLYFITMS